MLALCGLMIAGSVAAISSKKAEVVNADGLAYITKELKKDDLQVNNVTLTQNRFQLAFCVPASVDHPEDAELRGAYYTNGDGKTLTSLAAWPAEESYANVLARIKVLNLVQGNLLVDGNQMLYRKDSVRDVYRLHDTVEGRIVLVKNADSTTDMTKMRLKVMLDVNIPNYAVGMHTVTLKAGTVLPSWSYAINNTIGTTGPTTVYKTLKDMTWSIYWNGSNFVVQPKSYTDVSPTCVGTVGFNATGMFKSWKVNDTRVGFAFDTACSYARYTTNGYNTLAEPQTHYYNSSDYITWGNATQLNVWEKILINGERANAYYNDDRFRNNGSSALEDGGSYGRAWFDCPIAKLTESTYTIQFLKGLQIPTPETVTDATKATYLTLDRDWTFTIAKGANDFTWSCTSVVASSDEGIYDAVSEETEVTGMALSHATQDGSFMYAKFNLTNYDSETVNNTFNNKSLYWSGQYNAFDKIYLNKDTTKGIKATIGDASGRSYRTAVGPNAVGFPIATVDEAPTFTAITIPAGTRFPAAAYVCGENSGNVDALPVAANMKFYVTTKDVTLVKSGSAWVTEVQKEADDFGETFLTSIECDNGVTAPSATNWAAMATAYSELSAEAQAILKNAVAKEDGNGAEKCVARYDYIIKKYGTTNYANFMGRTVSSSNSTTIVNNTNTVNIAIIVVLLTAVAATTAATILFARRKKTQR